MGCSDATQKKLVDVGGDLLFMLLQSAVKLLAVAALEDGEAVPAASQETFTDSNSNAAQLEKDLQILTERQYLIEFMYTYNGNRSRPKDLDPTPGSLVKSHEDMVSVRQGDTTAITNYVDNTILGGGGGGLPQWFTDQFSNDLISTMTTIAQKANSNWQYEKFEQQYTDPAGAKHPISANIIMCYANGDLVEDGQDANESIIYFAGIYYNSLGWNLTHSIPGVLVNNYPIVQVGIATGTIIVAAALAAFILRAPPPAAGVSFRFLGTSLQVVLFRKPSTSLQRIAPRKTTVVEGVERRRLETVVAGVDSTWVEKLLDAHNFGYTVTQTTSDRDMTAQISLELSYSQEN